MLMRRTLFEPSPASDAIVIPQPSFDDDRENALSQGLVLVSFRRLGLAVRDTRCTRPHMQVLLNLMEHMSHDTGTAYCSRRAIGEEEGLSEKTVENVLYDLRAWHYVDWSRRAFPDLHRGRLLHYVLPVCRYSEDEITAAIMAMRVAKGQKVPVLTGIKSPRPGGENGSEVPVPTGTRVPPPNGDFLNGSTRPNGENPAKSPRPGGVRNIYIKDKKEAERKSPRPNGDFNANVEAALEMYNAAAKTHGFTVSRVVSTDIRTRLSTRLSEIGGLDKWTLALSAISADDFMMGRLPSKDPGGRRFKLDLEYLLQTKGRSGDVLVKLLNRALDTPTCDDIEGRVAELKGSPIGKELIRTHGEFLALQKIRESVLSTKGEDAIG